MNQFRSLCPSVPDPACLCPTLINFTLIYLTLSSFSLLCRAQGKVTECRADVADERSLMTTRATENTGAPQVHRTETRESTETKSAYKTTELIVYALAV